MYTSIQEFSVTVSNDMFQINIVLLNFLFIK